MLQQIMNMLWNSRRHNLWIMLELVVITIVSWAVLDPLFVLTYNQSIPNGYDAEGLYRLEVTRNKADIRGEKRCVSKFGRSENI